MTGVKSQKTGSRKQTLLVGVTTGYFGLWLLPHLAPGLKGTAFFLIYALSLPVVILILLALGVWGLGGIVIGRFRGTMVNQRHKTFVSMAGAGVGTCLIVLVVVSVVEGPLPTGSHLKAFDPTLWKAPRASEYVEGDITPRQKMLKDVVVSVLPGKHRSELEALLGASLETAYFQSSGHDLIYHLGPQRDTLFPIDSEWLLVWLDDTGRFERYAIASD